jgi:hypothetical protein
MTLEWKRLNNDLRQTVAVKIYVALHQCNRMKKELKASMSLCPFSLTCVVNASLGFDIETNGDQVYRLG